MIIGLCLYYQQRMGVKIQGERSLAHVNSTIGREHNLQNLLNPLGCVNILKTHGFGSRTRLTQPLFLGYLYLEWAPWDSLQDLVTKQDDIRTAGGT
jgi:hypothetical protein